MGSELCVMTGNGTGGGRGVNKCDLSLDPIHGRVTANFTSGLAQKPPDDPLNASASWAAAPGMDSTRPSWSFVVRDS